MSIIYEPQGRAREYSPLAANLYSGCSHGCVYCYGPKILRMDSHDYSLAEAPRVDAIQLFRKDAERLAGDGRQVLLSFIGDPYCLAEREHRLTHQALEICLEYHIPVAILTKGGERCLQDLDLFRCFGNHIKIGASLTFSDEAHSRDWEPGAAKPESRLIALEKLHWNHIPTWASMEPVILPDESLELIRVSIDFVDEYRLGKLNHIAAEDNGKDWIGYLSRALAILRPAKKKIYVKTDLRAAVHDWGLLPGEALQDRYLAAPWEME